MSYNQTATICPQQAFFTCVERERERAGRNGSVFCIVMLRCCFNGRRFSGAVKALCSRLRSYDVITRLMEDCFCVLLPDTDRNAAELLLTDVTRSKEWNRCTVRRRVLCYPSDWTPVGNTAASSLQGDEAKEPRRGYTPEKLQ